MSKKNIIMISVILLTIFLAIAGINTYQFYTNPKDEQNVDSNIYLNESVCFAKEVYISVSGLKVEKEEDYYFLHLSTNVEQKCSDGEPDNVKIESKNFVLKSVNLLAKNKMSVFFQCLFKASISALVSGAVGGDINIIEETISFIGDYTSESISNAIDSNTKFKNTKTNNSFEPFYPKDKDGITTLDLVFPLKISNLEETNNVIVLTIDQWNHVERRIFLITRPSTIE